MEREQDLFVPNGMISKSKKVLLCQFDALEYYAYMILSTQLLSRGIRCEVEVINNDDRFIRKLDAEFDDCEIIGFQCANVDYARIIDLAQRIKESYPHRTIVLGGAHPTLNPELIDFTKIDFICIGAGESYFVEWVAEKRYKFKENYHNIVCNITEPFETIFNARLDTMPFPDRDIYYEKYHVMRMYPVRRFIFSLGCPYRCTYCYNINFREKYSDYPRHVIFKNARKAIDEIKVVLNKYPATGIVFLDDNFCIDREWLFTFLELYRKEINLPFEINATITALSHEIIEELARSRFKIVRVAMETTNSVIRTTILDRPPYTNDQVSAVIKKLRYHGIRLVLQNMFCLPTQTLDDCVEAIRFAANNKVFMYVTILVPFRGTKIYQYCLANNYLQESCVIEDMHGKATLQGEEMERMVALHDCMFLLNCVPTLIKPIVWLTKYVWFRRFSHRYFHTFNLIVMHIPMYFGLAPFYRFCIMGFKVLVCWRERWKKR